MTNKEEKKNMWAKVIGNHIYIFHNGKVIYKRWIDKKGNKTQPSILFNENGWPNEWISNN